MRPRFVPQAPPPPPTTPILFLEEANLASIRQQHFVAFSIILMCAVIFITVISITERNPKAEE